MENLQSMPGQGITADLNEYLGYLGDCEGKLYEANSLLEYLNSEKGAIVGQEFRLSIRSNGEGIKGVSGELTLEVREGLIPVVVSNIAYLLNQRENLRIKLNELLVKLNQDLQIALDPPQETP